MSTALRNRASRALVLLLVLPACGLELVLEPDEPTPPGQRTPPGAEALPDDRPVGCDVNGVMHGPGALFRDACRDCVCGEDGNVRCGEPHCATCQVPGGAPIQEGEVVSSPDSCGQCTCTGSGDLACPAIACGP